MNYRKLSEAERKASRDRVQQRYREGVRIRAQKNIPVEEDYGVVARLVALAFKKPIKVGR